MNVSGNPCCNMCGKQFTAPTCDCKQYNERIKRQAKEKEKKFKELRSKMDKLEKEMRDLMKSDS